MRIKLYIDGDIWSYKYSYCTEQVSYTVYMPEFETFQTFKYAKDANWVLKCCKEYGLECYRKQNVKMLPVSRAFTLIEAEWSRLREKFGVRKEDMHVVLSSPNKEDNPRYTLAKTKVYKENRSGRKKPCHFSDVREYLIQEKGAEVVVGMEADDRIGIAMGKEGCIGVSDDKDLRMIPGKLYVPGKNKFIEISDPGSLSLVPGNGKKVLEGTGFAWFCAQTLLGDPTDNIPGITGYGDVRTYKYLKDCNTETEYWSLVVRAYRTEKILYRLKEISQLLWISREEGQDVPYIGKERLV